MNACRDSSVCRRAVSCEALHRAVEGRSGYWPEAFAGGAHFVRVTRSSHPGLPTMKSILPIFFALILRGRRFGFSLEEIRSLLALAEDDGLSCQEVDHLARLHLVDIRARLGDLERMASELERVIDGCSGGEHHAHGYYQWLQRDLHAVCGTERRQPHRAAAHARTGRRCWSAK